VISVFQPIMAAYSANQVRACSNSSGRKNFTGARRTPAPAKARARESERGSATMAILEILPRAIIKSRSSQSAPRCQPSEFSRMTSKRGLPSDVDIARECALPGTKFGSLQNPADAQHIDVVMLILPLHRHDRAFYLTWLAQKTKSWRNFHDAFSPSRST
jgi:hypothetical protein